MHKFPLRNVQNTWKSTLNVSLSSLLVTRAAALVCLGSERSVFSASGDSVTADVWVNLSCCLTTCTVRCAFLCLVDTEASSTEKPKLGTSYSAQTTGFLLSSVLLCLFRSPGLACTMTSLNCPMRFANSSLSTLTSGQCYLSTWFFFLFCVIIVYTSWLHTLSLAEWCLYYGSNMQNVCCDVYLYLTPETSVLRLIYTAV